MATKKKPTGEIHAGTVPDAAPLKIRRPRKTKAASGIGSDKKASARGKSRASAGATERVAPGSNGTPLSSGMDEVLRAGVSEYEQIALLAYSFWEARGRQGGSPEEDWYRAEREVRRLKEGSTKET